jgi:peptide/nickel transport system substrate-binding protein
MPRKSLRLAAASAGLVLTSAVALTACGTTTSAPTAAAKNSTVPFVFVNAPSSPFVRNFNPWSPSYTFMWPINEPLLNFNDYTGKITPKLAASYQIENNGKTIVFDLRHHVQWSNGAPFTSKDVVFTLDMLLSHPAMDVNALNTMISSVKADGPYKVIVNLKARDNAALFYIGGDTAIVYAKQWEKVKNPVTYTDPNPITTGPFIVKSVTRSLITLVRNPHYWNKPEPYIKTVEYPLYLSNNTASLAMIKGQFAMADQFIPDIQRTLIDKNPKYYHYWFPPFATNVLWTNDGVYPFNLVGFRQALSLAINRNKVAKLGEYGYETPVNATGLPNAPAYARYFDRSLIASHPLEYDPAKARAILKKLGFSWNSAGHLVDPKGQVVTAPILAISGATDWIADANIIAKELGAIGIVSRVHVIAGSTFGADMAKGNFKLAISSTDGGPSPYYIYDPLLASAYSAPEGQNAPSNYERWINSKTDALLNEYATATTKSQKVSAMYALEKQFVKDMPVIPLMDFPAWDQYNTEHFTGFPTPKNPYAALDYGFNYMYVIARIRPKT